MNRLKFILDGKNYYITNYICCGENLFLQLVDETKEPFKGNVICVNNRFEIIHRFDSNTATSIWTDHNSIVLDCFGYQFYFDPSNFIKQFTEWAK